MRFTVGKVEGSAGPLSAWDRQRIAAETRRGEYANARALATAWALPFEQAEALYNLHFNR
jgi:hypothetical protein